MTAIFELDSCDARPSYLTRVAAPWSVVEGLVRALPIETALSGLLRSTARRQRQFGALPEAEKVLG